MNKIIMNKIRIPRKKKKKGYIYYYNFPCVPKVNRYFNYFVIEDGIKNFGRTAEQLCNTFGRYVMDEVIWWNWVRWKELGVKPDMSQRYQEYWDYFANNGIINYGKDSI